MFTINYTKYDKQPIKKITRLIFYNYIIRKYIRIILLSVSYCSQLTNKCSNHVPLRGNFLLEEHGSNSSLDRHEYVFEFCI